VKYSDLDHLSLTYCGYIISVYISEASYVVHGRACKDYKPSMHEPSHLSLKEGDVLTVSTKTHILKKVHQLGNYHIPSVKLCKIFFLLPSSQSTYYLPLCP
jgi:hypothetical protein